MASGAYAELRSQQADVLRRLPQGLRTWTDELLKRQARELTFHFPDDVTRRYLYESWVSYFGGEACVGASLDRLVLNCIVATPSPSNPAVPLFVDVVLGGASSQTPAAARGKKPADASPPKIVVSSGETNVKDVPAATKDKKDSDDKQKDTTSKDTQSERAQGTDSASSARTKVEGSKQANKDETTAATVKVDSASTAAKEATPAKGMPEDAKNVASDVRDAEKISKTSVSEVAAGPDKRDDAKKPATAQSTSSKVVKISSKGEEKENVPADVNDTSSVELRHGAKNATSNNAVHNKFSFFKWRPASLIERRKSSVGGVKLRRSLMETTSAPPSRERGAVIRQPSFAAPSALKFLIYLSKLLETSKENREALDEAGMIIGFCSLLLSLVSFKTRTQVESYFRDRVGGVLSTVIPSASFRGVVPVPNRRFLEVLHEQLTRGCQLQTQISVLAVCQYLYFKEAGDGKFPELDMRFLREGYLNHTIGTGLGALSLLRALQEKTKLNPAAILRFLNSDVTRESCERVEEFLKHQKSLAAKKSAGKTFGKFTAQQQQQQQHTWPWCRVVDQRQFSNLMTRANAFYAMRVVCCLNPPPEDRMWKCVEFVPEEVKKHEREWGDMFRRHLKDGSIRKASDSMLKHREGEWARALDAMYFVEDFELLSVGSYKKGKSSTTEVDGCGRDETTTAKTATTAGTA
ncbi:uncharacterized protein LOC119400428 [Rhipicephalus sanguineus]|uniref:uncharacterized protein LOC119400428 n=1 Tax=Rhipicephalus sanguineus TaxID=34632 RepID=UPI001896117F|nr:uncharacterized protein LOC119400428 [Rhipicephalus sanguineus]